MTWMRRLCGDCDHSSLDHGKYTCQKLGPWGCSCRGFIPGAIVTHRHVPAIFWVCVGALLEWAVTNIDRLR